ncbi:MAG: hypothetical protein H7334_07120, partial [Ferruginibacter sp.]|nr:hypothetical protein [Ferruginibacter sp.]
MALDKEDFYNLQNPLFVSIEDHDSGGKIFTLRKRNSERSNSYTKLTDVFTKMPYGLIHKEETGIGATTLELKAKRNSIIVEPIKVTASTKAYKEKGAFYVGS